MRPHRYIEKLEYPLSRVQILPVGSRRRKETKRFLKFAIVGALGAVTDFTILNLLVQVAGILPVVANGFGFSGGRPSELRIEPVVDIPGESQSNN